ncbi:MAG: glycosyltransferase [Candidatus Aenigmarchaeota archaeon]|nr:glycosyltransferase [Candidatus Aenigmarchaeota archaeon]
MKIAFFTDTYKPQVNGVVTSIDLFADELRKNGHEVHIFCPKGDKTPKSKYIHPLISFKFRPYPEYRIGFPSLKIMKIIKDIEPDIIHIHGPASVGLLGLSVAKYMRVPIVMTYHTFVTDYVHYLSKRKFIEKYNKKMVKKYTKWFFNRADLIITPSTPIKRILRRYGIKKPIEVLPTGIKIKNTKRTEKFKKPAILHVGRVTKEKRIDSVIKAFKKISQKIDANLIITSDGPYRKNLEDLVRKMELEKNVKFTGYISDEKIIELYKKSYVLVCASRTETQGLIVLEAMAYGCPVVVSNRLGFKDFVKDEENGLLFNKDSEIPEKILRILNDPKLRKEIIKNGYATAREYSIESCAKKLENLYRGLMI